MSETPNTGELQTSNPASDQEYQRAAEVLAEVFQDVQNNLRQSSEKTYASLIDYTDRIILLAGGTLTLTLTAVATVGAHLRESHRDATHIEYVTTPCWLLMATIIFGLIYNNYIIRLRHRDEVQNGLQVAHIQAKIKLLSITGEANRAAIEAIPPPPGTDDPKKQDRVREVPSSRRWRDRIPIHGMLGHGLWESNPLHPGQHSSNAFAMTFRCGRLSEARD